MYGKQWPIKRKSDGAIVRGFSPALENPTKDDIRASDGSNKKWARVSDDTVLQHIRGEEVHTYYLLQQDGTIKFGAIDFDCKAGREDQGYAWEDVARAAALLTEWGITYGIARSTGTGFHIYIFFEEFISAAKYRSLVLDIFERLGFTSLVRQNLKLLPEIFPKQTYVARDGVGNGITPPMMEPNFVKGKNCFVDAENKVVGEGLASDAQIEFQWRYLDSVPRVTSAKVDELIEKLGITVIEDFNSGTGRDSYDSLRGRESAKWQPPLNGSIEKVLEGCASFRKIRDKALKGVVLGHDEGFALYHLCMATFDGLDWFKENVPGWGKTDSQIKQLEHSLEKKNYSPWSCEKLQEKGICPAGTSCFEAKPPREMVDGIETIREDVPKMYWPKVSPIRYAFGRGEDFLLKLLKEADELPHIKEDGPRLAALQSIAKRVQVFDEGQQKILKEHVKKVKVFKRAELSKVFNEAEEERASLSEEKAESRDDVIRVEDNLFRKLPFGYSMIKTGKGGKTTEHVLCSVDIEEREHRKYLDGTKTIDCFISGVARASNVPEREFQFTNDDWWDNNKFLATFHKVLGSAWSPQRKDIDNIRQAAQGFSRKRGIEDTTFLTCQGYHGESYLMPSVVVGRDGVRPNTSSHVDLQNRQFGKEIDFSLLNEEEFREVMLHIKTDLLHAWPEHWVFTGIAHTLLPALVEPMGWNKKATLFYEGLTGSGKTELTHNLQYFWGNFPRVCNLSSTGKALQEISYEFKDCLLVCDDYKGLDRTQVAALVQVIQYTFDSNYRLKLDRDSTQKSPKPSRAVFMMSGEEFATNEASVVSRTILIEVEKYDTRTTRSRFQRVEKMRDKYRGVTPRFISWFLNQDRSEIEDFCQSKRVELKEKFAGRQNADRVAQNLAVNHTTWRLWTRFMVASNVATGQEAEDLCAEHWRHMVALQGVMLERCEDEQSAIAFVRLLTQLISSGAVSIKNMAGYDIQHKQVIGRLPDSKDLGNVVYIYPEIAYQVVKGFAKNSPIGGTERSLGRQLADLGYLKCCDKGRLKKQVRSENGREMVWVMDLGMLGFEAQACTRFPRQVGKVLEFRPGSEPRLDADGIF